ncbi:hypothetical protein I4F81_005799 [Pyropia yezoensis]|uniref:Uncharacterized protein n=1 Tax=Pyropia yezoensis TaxID=2788 RepID=A0ACC3BZQ6_PYRYE|nr:hypothetical protein I4F81_005799 [Neopyropia yezoensis]
MGGGRAILDEMMLAMDSGGGGRGGPGALLQALLDNVEGGAGGIGDHGPGGPLESMDLGLGLSLPADGGSLGRDADRRAAEALAADAVAASTGRLVGAVAGGSASAERGTAALPSAAAAAGGAATRADTAAHDRGPLATPAGTDGGSPVSRTADEAAAERREGGEPQTAAAGDETVSSTSASVDGLYEVAKEGESFSCSLLDSSAYGPDELSIADATCRSGTLVALLPGGGATVAPGATPPIKSRPLAGPLAAARIADVRPRVNGRFATKSELAKAKLGAPLGAPDDPTTNGPLPPPPPPTGVVVAKVE